MAPVDTDMGQRHTLNVVLQHQISSNKMSLFFFDFFWLIFWLLHFFLQVKLRKIRSGTDIPRTGLTAPLGSAKKSGKKLFSLSVFHSLSQWVKQNRVRVCLEPGRPHERGTVGFLTSAPVQGNKNTNSWWKTAQVTVFLDRTQLILICSMAFSSGNVTLDVKLSRPNKTYRKGVSKKQPRQVFPPRHQLFRFCRIVFLVLFQCIPQQIQSTTESR